MAKPQLQLDQQQQQGFGGGRGGFGGRGGGFGGPQGGRHAGLRSPIKKLRIRLGTSLLLHFSVSLKRYPRNMEDPIGSILKQHGGYPVRHMIS